MTNKTLITATGILCVTILTLFAMHKGIDGAMFMTALAVIGGLAGYELRTLKEKVNK